jgi:hypothetical protein
MAWWGEGDDMIWVDGYKWPPDLHGTGSEDYLGQAGGMQDIEIGHANHLANEMSSVAYWYAEQPSSAMEVPTVQQRLPVRRDNAGQWLRDPERECPGKPVPKPDENGGQQ